ncbi:DEAD/DEAH box helicase [Paenibacillus cellulositrophicus]|uniref:DEAD/DEAH box helicase n=1 Tax=Paenibacillus cellulositrophicus TaxID=562959 RepID=UPI002041E1D4|nr:DEAD/DEAH box helicase [Paenibacillus cellulositrophicus]MCM3000509.1 DEAD/DEAH box helicase [Paenibacillus cellulositrophicus]
MKGLTLLRLRNTSFNDLYQKLLFGKVESKKEYTKLLSIAIIFINEKSLDLTRLGYRVLVMYCNLTKDYKPLYDIALNEGLIPVVKLIENLDKYKTRFSESFFNSFISAMGENFKSGSMYLSDQQEKLYSFFNSTINETVSVVAPTSYGKSELIISTLKNMASGNTCIIVPTKALLAQTKRRLIKEDITNINKIITHPEMYIEGEENITAVLTQERLLRLLRRNPDLSFNMVFIDEAHNLLDDNERSILLAATISILEKRNRNVVFKFLTPFLIDESNLQVKYSHYSIDTFRITEYIKTEKFYIYDFRNKKKFTLYDQFMDDFYTLDAGNYTDDIDFILKNKTKKNLIYLNKPADIEKVAGRLIPLLSENQSEKIAQACNEISEYMHSDYFLIECIKKGFIYHHGSVPDNVRLYVENLFSNVNDMEFVITSSTLLEGVNLPVEKMFLLDNKKGRGVLSPSQFKNLIGRVCRFNEIFSPVDGSLEKLEPQIYLVGSSYFSKNANINDFIRSSMKVDKKIKDDPSNVLLKNVEINDDNFSKKDEADDFIENFEPGLVPNYGKNHVKTKIGKLCFMNNTNEIDILLNEEYMQEIAESIELNSISTAEEVFEIFTDLFLPFIRTGDAFDNLRRLDFEESRRFYQMFLNWRIKNASFREMINSILRYWAKVEKSSDTLVFVGRWGDKTRGGFREFWTDISGKTKTERVNLAIVRIKEEQDFLDNTFIKYIEVMNDLGILTEEFYEKIKYGTNNKDMIVLIKNGFSNGLASLIVNNYRKFIEIDKEFSSVYIRPSLISKMIENNENDILIYEAKYNSRSNLQEA